MMWQSHALIIIYGLTSLYCGKEGHTAFHCEKRNSDEKREKNGEKAMFAFGEQSSNIEDYMSEDSERIDIGL